MDDARAQCRDSHNPSPPLQTQSSHGPSSDTSAPGLKIENPSSVGKTNRMVEAVPSASSSDKRKAQNQAAQRAFRERKERHIKDLHDRFAQLQQNISVLREENDQKRQEITTALAENHTLKELESMPAAFRHDLTPILTYTSFADMVAPGDHNKQPTHRVTTDPDTGERFMDLGAAWDFIQQHALFQEGMLDLEKVCNYLREQVQCDGQGPVFVENCVIHAIEASVTGMRVDQPNALDSQA